MRRTICFYVLVSNVLIMLQGLRTDQASTTAVQHREEVEISRNETSLFLIQAPVHDSRSMFSKTPNLFETDNPALAKLQPYSDDSCLFSRSYCKQTNTFKQGSIEVDIRRHATRQGTRDAGRSDTRNIAQRRIETRRDVVNTRRGPTYRLFGFETARVKPEIRYDRESRTSSINTNSFEQQRNYLYSMGERVQENANRRHQQGVEINTERTNRRMPLSQQRKQRREQEDTNSRRQDRREDIDRRERNENIVRNDRFIFRNKMQDNRGLSRLSRRSSFGERTLSRLEELPARRTEAARRLCSPSVLRNERTGRLTLRNENGINKRYQSRETEQRSSESTSIMLRSSKRNQLDQTVREVSNHNENERIETRCLFRTSRAVSTMTTQREWRTNTYGKSRNRDEYNSNTIRATHPERTTLARDAEERQRRSDESPREQHRLNHRLDSNYVRSYDTDVRIQGERTTHIAVRNREYPRVRRHTRIDTRSKTERNRITRLEENRRNDQTVNKRYIETGDRRIRVISRSRDETERLSVTPRLSTTTRANYNVDQRLDHQEFRTGQRGIVTLEREHDTDRRRDLLAKGSPEISRHDRSTQRSTARQDNGRYRFRTQRERRHDDTRRNKLHGFEELPKKMKLKQEFSLADIPPVVGLKSFFEDVISSVNTGTVSQAVLLVAVGMIGQRYWQKSVDM